jgi:hypothetical protein
MYLESKMAAVSDEKIREVAVKLWTAVYEEPFRGKDRGRFCLTREQMKAALGTGRLHATTIERLQDEALSLGLVIIDLDDLFPCVEVRIIRKYRRPPGDIFLKHFPEPEDDRASEGEEDE